jgi:hypothetical protein
MGRNMIAGIIDNTGKTGLVANSIVEHAMAIIFGAEVGRVRYMKRYMYGMVWYGIVWHGMVLFGMVWYGVMWYGIV